MTDDYRPEADFLVMVSMGVAPLTGSVFAEANLRKLIELTSDHFDSNRDWATFLLSHASVDSSEVRAALHLRLNDDSEVVQEEAMVGLAMRKDVSAIPVLRGWMDRDGLSMIILEAATEFADASLCQPLAKHRKWAEDASLQVLWRQAWSKCSCTCSSA